MAKNFLVLNDDGWRSCRKLIMISYSRFTKLLKRCNKKLFQFLLFGATLQTAQFKVVTGLVHCRA